MKYTNTIEKLNLEVLNEVLCSVVQHPSADEFTMKSCSSLAEARKLFTIPRSCCYDVGSRRGRGGDLKHTKKEVF